MIFLPCLVLLLYQSLYTQTPVMSLVLLLCLVYWQVATNVKVHYHQNNIVWLLLI